MTSPTRGRGLALAAAAALLTSTAVACTASDSDDSGTSSGAGSAADERTAELAEGASPANLSAVDASGGGTDGAGEAPAQQAVISQGNVQLKDDDVGQAIFEVRKVVDLHQGVIEQDATETDDDGRPLRARMVLRIPAGDFGAAMVALGQVGTLIASSSTSEDVTTTVLDNNVRVEVEKRSIRRISVLLDQATSIRDIVSIESQLSQRQADLASLERQQRYLADQTTMSTITVSVERTGPKAKPERDRTGFLAGLGAGWKGMSTFAVALSTVFGALLPWVALLVILAVPGWPLLRRLRRGRRSEPALL